MKYIDVTEKKIKKLQKEDIQEIRKEIEGEEIEINFTEAQLIKALKNEQ